MSEKDFDLQKSCRSAGYLLFSVLEDLNGFYVFAKVFWVVVRLMLACPNLFNIEVPRFLPSLMQVNENYFSNVFVLSSIRRKLEPKVKSLLFFFESW